jgi:type I restriction enzyme S subunit
MILNKTSFVSLDEVTFITKLAGFEYTKYLSNNFVDFGIPVIQGRNIKNGSLNFENIKFIKEELSNSLKRSQVKKNMLLFSYVGTVGDVYLHSSDKILHLGSNVAKIVPNESLINPYFLFYSLKSPLFLKSLFSKTKGSVQSNINMKDMRSIKIWLPELKKQKSIVDYLYDIDKKIEVNNKIIKNLEELAQTLYKRWFVDFEFPNKEGQPYKSSGGEMIDSELGLIPKGWEVTSLKVLVNKNSDKATKSKDLKLIDMATMPSSSIGLTNYSEGDKLSTNTFHMRKFSFLYGSIRPYLKKYGIAAFDGITTGTIHNFTVKDVNDYSFVAAVVFSDLFNQFCIKLSHGTKMPVINWNDFTSYKITYNKKVNESLNNIVKPFFEIIVNNVLQNIELNKLRDLLLPKLMLGEIEVQNME